MSFQFQNSFYTVNYLNYSSWLDAEHYCANYGSHLWSINSFDEWYNVYQSVQHTSMFEETGASGTNLIMISTLLFIGLTKNYLVERTYCNIQYLKI